MPNLVIVTDEGSDPTVISLNGAMVKVLPSPDDDPNMFNPIITLHNNVENHLTVQIHDPAGVFIAVEYQ